jgi:hypothetical protein
VLIFFFTLTRNESWTYVDSLNHLWICIL